MSIASFCSSSHCSGGLVSEPTRSPLETLSQQVITRCVALPDCLALAEVMLERYENQFSRVLVERAFCYILLSRYGMEAQELIGMLQCSQAAWSTFYLVG